MICDVKLVSRCDPQNFTHIFGAQTAPVSGDLGGDVQAKADAALAQSFMHWGFLTWAILGSLTTVMLMHYHYDNGLPLAPRTLLYPVFGDRALIGPIGLIADASCIIAVVAGTVGPIGFLGLQMSYALNSGGIGKLQSFIVVTAVPVSLILLPTLWDALRITLMLGRTSGVGRASEVGRI